MKYIILFDGDCHFCNQNIQFIIKRDPNVFFSFASLQSKVGKKLFSSHLSTHVDSLILIEQDQVYTKSTAALRISKRLNGIWKLFYILILVPKPIRDFFYDIIAKNRLNWFGQAKTCLIPNQVNKQRFL